MEQKLNETISLEKISLLMLNEDVESLVDFLKVNTFENSELFCQNLLNLKDENDLAVLVVKLAKYFDELISNDYLDFGMLIQQFLQRYTFCLNLNQDYLNYSKDLKVQLLFQQNTGKTFEAIFVPFFNSQIEFYLRKYLSSFKVYPVQEWSAILKQEIEFQISSFFIEEDFAERIAKIEDLVSYFQDIEEIYEKIDFYEDDENKKAFLLETNELKIILGSINMLMEQVIKKLKLGNRGVN